MAKKTNRTSHVMDLLTNGASGEAPEAANEASGAAQEKKSDVQSHTVTPAKVTVVDEGSINDRVSQEILGKLTEELDAEKAQEAAQADAAPAQEAAPQAADNPDSTDSAPQAQEDVPAAAQEDISQSSQAQETVSETAAEEFQAETAKEAPQGSQEAPASSEAAPAPGEKTSGKAPHPIIPESHFGRQTIDHEYRFINVMEQLLMRQDLEAVLKQHGVCTCHHCMSDVCALALTGLPAKYVVVSKDSISPLLSYYENKYRIPVLTELMKACSRVREYPHHNRTE